MTTMPSPPELSVVIPIYNEQDGLAALFARLYPALDALRLSYEIIFVNDGSRDNSVSILAEQFRQRPDVTRVVLFNGNYGQHMAILAGFEASRGQTMVTRKHQHLRLHQLDLLTALDQAQLQGQGLQPPQ